MKYYILLLLLFAGNTAYAQNVDKAFAVYFEFDSYALSPKAMITIDSIITDVKGRKDYSITISGYTDDAGTADYNKRLALNRANAAKDYMEQKGISVASTVALNYTADKNKTLTPEEKRMVSITVKYTNKGGNAAGSKEQKYTAPGGTIVTPSVPLGDIKVTEFFSARSMIAGGMYCLDVDGNILQTAGMIEICRKDLKLDVSGAFYTVMLPRKQGRIINTSMTVWAQVKSNNGTLRWENTPITITTDPTNKYYIFKFPVGIENCIKINLDMPCVNGNDCKIVYIATAKPYDFYNVSVTNPKSSLSFSAKVNDTLWAFTAGSRMQVRNMTFTGNYKEAGKEKKLKVILSNAKHTPDEDGNEHYYICEDCRVENESGKGFFNWIKNLFK